MSIKPHLDHVDVGMTVRTLGKRRTKVRTFNARSESAVTKTGVRITTTFVGPLNRTYQNVITATWDEVFALVKHRIKRGGVKKSAGTVLRTVLPKLLPLLLALIMKERKV